MEGDKLNSIINPDSLSERVKRLERKLARYVQNTLPTALISGIEIVAKSFDKSAQVIYLDEGHEGNALEVNKDGKIIFSIDKDGKLSGNTGGGGTSEIKPPLTLTANADSIEKGFTLQSQDTDGTPVFTVPPTLGGIVIINGNLAVSGTVTGIGVGDKKYTHVQSIPNKTWTINHNLGKYPAVSMRDDYQRYIGGDITYPTINQVVADFGIDVSGFADCN